MVTALKLTHLMFLGIRWWNISILKIKVLRYQTKIKNSTLPCVVYDVHYRVCRTWCRCPARSLPWKTGVSPCTTGKHQLPSIEAKRFPHNREALLLDELTGSVEERWVIANIMIQIMTMSSHTTTITRWAVVNIVAHELAHQWTGNLVTLTWSDQ